MELSGLLVAEEGVRHPDLGRVGQGQVLQATLRNRKGREFSRRLILERLIWKTYLILPISFLFRKPNCLKSKVIQTFSFKKKEKRSKK